MGKQDKIKEEIGEERKNRIVKKLTEFKNKVIEKQNELPTIDDNHIFMVIPKKKEEREVIRMFIDKSKIDYVNDIWYSWKNNSNIQTKIKDLSYNDIIDIRIGMENIQNFVKEKFRIKEEKTITPHRREPTPAPAPASAPAPQQFIGIYKPLTVIKVNV